MPDGGSASTASSSVVLPAPGALIRLTTATPWRSEPPRLARARQLFAAGPAPAPATDSSCTPQLLHGLEHEIDGARDRAADCIAEPESDLLDDLGFARHHEHAARPAADVLDESQHRLRVHAVRVEQLPVLDL